MQHKTMGWRSKQDAEKKIFWKKKQIVPVLSSNIIMLFQAKLCCGFNTVAFLQAFNASMWRFRSAY